MTPNAFRALFSSLDTRCYLNSAGAGLSPPAVGEAAWRFHRDAKSLGLEGRPIWRRKIEDVRTLLAGYLEVRSDNVEFHASASEAMSLLAMALAWSRPTVIACRDDHPSVWRPWEGVVPFGVNLVLLDGAPRDLLLPTAAREHKADLVVTSHVDWRTGARIDLESLAVTCRALGACLIVDGSQAVGAIPSQAALADAYLGSTFKWLLSGFGLGYLATSEGLRARLKPVARGHANPPPSCSLKPGHINLGGVFELEAALTLLLAARAAGIADRAVGLATTLRESCVNAGYEVLTPCSHAAIISIAVDNSEAIEQRLRIDGISVQAHPGVLRFSPHLYNNGADLERCMAALSRHVR